MEEPEMKTLTFGATYGAPPFFCHDIEHMGHVELEEIPLTEALRMAIRDWDHLFQLTFCSDYPPDSGFRSIETEQEFNQQGCELFKKIKEELEPALLVTYRT